MEDNNDDLANLPNDLRQQIINHRIVRNFGLRAIVRSHHRRFWNDIEKEMWQLLSLPGEVQPQLFTVMFGKSVLRQLRRQARSNVLEANAHRIAEHNYWAQHDEAQIRRSYYTELASVEGD